MLSVAVSVLVNLFPAGSKHVNQVMTVDADAAVYGRESSSSDAV